MVRATDDSENIEFHGVVTVLPHPLVSGGDGSLELAGTLYTDNILSDNSANPVNVHGVKIKDSTVSITNGISTPNVPAVGDHIFFVKDSQLKSIDSNSVLTTYQPTNTKGDIIVHNGTTQVRLPIGDLNSTLSVDTNTSTGLKWVPREFTLDEIRNQIRNKVTLDGNGQTNSTVIIDRVYSSVFANISPLVKNGASGVFLFSKSRDNIYGQCNRLTSTPDYISSKAIEGTFDPYSPPEVYKNYTGADGDYALISSFDYSKQSVTLSGTTWVSLPAPYDSLTGAFFISIYSDNNGACASFLICKSFSSSTGAVINRISNSPCSDNGQLELKWGVNSGISLRKTTNSNDFDYTVVDHFQQKNTQTIDLQGTTSIVIDQNVFRFYEKQCLIVRVISSVPDSPCSLYFITKNNRLTYGSKYSLRSPGKTTLEKIEVSWDPNSLFSIRKTGSNYSGNYNVEFVKFNFTRY